MTRDPLREEREIADYWKARAQDAEAAVEDLGNLAHLWKERAEKEQAAGMAVATDAARWRSHAERLAEALRDTTGYVAEQTGVAKATAAALAAHEALTAAS